MSLLKVNNDNMWNKKQKSSYSANCGTTNGNGRRILARQQREVRAHHRIGTKRQRTILYHKDTAAP